MAATQTESAELAAIVADDSSLIRDYVRAALGPRWRIYPVANGVEAVEFARTARPQLILLDVRMPRMDGIEACAQIRRMPECAGVPIAIITAYDDAAIRQRARHAGATRVFAKPFTFESLRSHIIEVLAAAANPVAHASAVPEHATDHAPRDGLGLLDGRETLDVCRRAEAAAEARPYASFAEVMEALRAGERF